MKTVENSYALASSVRDLNCRGIHLRWSFSLSLFDQRGSSAESGLQVKRRLRNWGSKNDGIPDWDHLGKSFFMSSFSFSSSFLNLSSSCFCASGDNCGGGSCGVSDVTCES